VTMLSSGIMNILPWGGPTARAASALTIDVSTVFVPMIPAMVIGVAWVLYVAYRLGVSERRRLALSGADDSAIAEVLEEELANPAFQPDTEHRRPDRLVINALLTMVLLVALIAAMLPLPVLFMLGFAIAVMLNYPTIDEQKALLSRHAGNVLAVVGLIFAAGVFTGILSGTKMVDAMADSVIRLVPVALGPYLAIVTGILSIPFTFLISNDAFYFGVLPILAKAGEAYGITAAEMARASLIGQPVHLLSPLVPSTFLLVGLAGVDFDDHQRYTLKWALVSALVLLTVGLVTMVIPVMGRAPLTAQRGKFSAARGTTFRMACSINATDRAVAPSSRSTTARAAAPSARRRVLSVSHTPNCLPSASESCTACAAPAAISSPASRLISHRGPNSTGTPNAAGSITECSPAE
jgi:CitMHS family citrate-Mg2+:H+ or citrate-Ca2+:H+ symporter